MSGIELRKNLAKRTEVYFIAIAAIASGLFSLLDLFGFLDAFPWFSSHLLKLILLLTSIMLGFLAIGIAGKLDTIELALSDLTFYIRQDTSKRVLSLRKQIAPNLEVVLGDHISDLLTIVERALKEQTIPIHDVDLFRVFYRRTLEAYPRATFLATSLPYQRYFWKNQPMEQAMASFIGKGGKMKRLFFINNLEELETKEVKEILSTQCKNDVEVYTLEVCRVPPQLKKFFLIETKGRIAWEIHIGPDHQITYVVVTTDPKTTERYKQMFEELLNIDGIKCLNPRKTKKSPSGRLPIAGKDAKGQQENENPGKA